VGAARLDIQSPVEHVPTFEASLSLLANRGRHLAYLQRFCVLTLSVVMPANFVARIGRFVVSRAKGGEKQLQCLRVCFHRICKLGFRFLFLTILRERLCLCNLNVVKGE
jgi:hypothetical protein